MKVALEVIPNFAWVGFNLFDRPGKRYRDPVDRMGAWMGFIPGKDPLTPETEAVTRWDLYPCPPPCLAPHFTWFRPRAVAPAMEASRT